MKKLLVLMAAMLLALACAQSASASSISVSQAGMEANTLMKSTYFTITVDVSDLGASGTVTLSDTPAGFSSDEGDSKSFSDSSTSVTWTTAKISQELSGRTISAQIDTTGEPATVTTSSFSVVSPPSLSMTVTPSSYTSAAGGATSTTIYMTLQNTGGSVASSVVAALSGCSGATITGATQTKSSMSAGESWSVSWPVGGTLAASCTMTVGVSSSNAGTLSGSVSFTKTPSGGSNPPGSSGDITPPAGPSFGGSSTTPSVITSATQEVALAAGTELGTSEALQVAVGKLLGAALTAADIEKMTALSKSLAEEFSVERTFSLGTNTTSLTLTIENTGARTIGDLVIWDVLTSDFGDAGSITVSSEGASMEIVDNASAGFAFSYGEFLPGQKMVIIYTVAGQKAASVINKTRTEIYASSIIEKLEPTKSCAPGTKRCSGKEIQSCSNDGLSWEVKGYCDYGCNPVTTTCNIAPGSRQAADYTVIVVALICIVVAVIAGVLIMKARKRPNI